MLLKEISILHFENNFDKSELTCSLLNLMNKLHI